MSEVPERIYLQWWGSEAPDDDPLFEVDAEDVTWCTDEIYEADVEYVRADLYTKTLMALRELYLEDWNGPLTENVVRARTVLKQAGELE